MELQRVFKRSYMESLKRNINIADYRGEKFPYDETQVRPLANVYRPEGLLEKLDPENDYKTAIAIYEAYEDLDPLVASLPDLWVYLAHVDLFPYVQKRWGGEEIEELDIRNHWHENKNFFLRTIFAGLWWNVKLTCDESRQNKYELTEVLFENAELRTTSFGELSLIRHKEAMIGILEFLKENPQLLKDGANARIRYIRKVFNILGGTREIAYLDRNFFKKELYERLEQIKVIRRDEDVLNGSEIINKI